MRRGIKKLKQDFKDKMSHKNVSFLACPPASKIKVGSDFPYKHNNRIIKALHGICVEEKDTTCLMNCVTQGSLGCTEWNICAGKKFGKPCFRRSSSR